MSRERKLVVVGLDCATPEPVFDAREDDLPTLGAVMSREVYSRLQSRIPAITFPAWSTMMTGWTRVRVRSNVVD
jgi:predicted AlkP superfamily phosphohydrolase/phosphomutase